MIEKRVEIKLDEKMEKLIEQNRELERWFQNVLEIDAQKEAQNGNNKMLRSNKNRFPNATIETRIPDGKKETNSR